MNVSEAVASRRSVRGFTDRPVDIALLKDLIERAARAPSGGNLQPWHIDVVGGARLDELKAIMAKKVFETPGGEGTEYDIYPKQLDGLYKQRNFQVGEDLYGRLGIPRENKAARMMWFARNFNFFGAPVALFCSVERHHGPPQWSDCGMYLQTLMLLIREAGMDSCPQECWAVFPKTVGAFIGIPEHRMLFTGMSIGWKDESEPANGFVAQRAPVEEWVRYHGI